MIPSGDIDLSRKIKDFAISTGFDLVGIAPSKKLTWHRDILGKWADSGMNADMSFLTRDIDKRSDPALLLDNAKSVIVVGLNYFPSELQGNDKTPVISKYAYGKDYHIVVSEKLGKLLNHIVELEPNASGKVCVDTSPIFEKAWAKETGLGWIGKNSILINREIGSYIFLGEIILNLELDYDNSFHEDLCGNCTTCIDSCPTSAINGDKTIDARKCISWLTVENKSQIPEEFSGKMQNRIFGCDICQEVCPWNKNNKSNEIPEFKLSDRLKNMQDDEWAALSSYEFENIFNQSAVKRVTYSKFIQNIKFVRSGGHKR